MLTLDLPLRPAESSALFETSVPVWTNRKTEVVQVGK